MVGKLRRAVGKPIQPQLAALAELLLTKRSHRQLVGVNSCSNFTKYWLFSLGK
jgi:hypothetical protein